MYAVNHLPVINLADSATDCCTLIHPKEWDNKTFIFRDKQFAVAHTRSFLHIPLNMNSVMTKAQKAIDDAGAMSDEWIILSKEISPWHAEHYFAVTKPVPGMELVKLSGKFMTKVFEGPYSDAGKWYQQLIDHVESKDKKPLNTYFFYTTCPNCAKAYGKNFVVGFEEVDEYA